MDDFELMVRKFVVILNEYQSVCDDTSLFRKGPQIPSDSVIPSRGPVITGLVHVIVLGVRINVNSHVNPTCAVVHGVGEGCQLRIVTHHLCNN
jgi:hypothetical protein